MPRYDLTRLSPQDFEELTRDLLQAEWNVALEAFKSGRDKGIDLRYSPADGGKTIIQCKHFAGSGYTKLLSHLRKTELPKVRTLNPDRYVIVTSVGLSAENKGAIVEVMHPFVLNADDVKGRGDIEGLLSRHSEVERANFKLWLTSTEVMTRVLHNAEQCHTDFEVDRVLQKLPIFVQSAAYPRAQEILSRSRVLVVSGVPGIGKTTLAEMLLYAHLEQGYEPVVIEADIKEGRKFFRKDHKQIFYFDDFLGQTFLRERRESGGVNRDAALIDFVEMVKRTEASRFILTTREHLLRSAVEDFERLRHSALLDHKCVLELSDYSTRQRARILYNHMFFGDLPRAYKEQVLRDDFFLKVVKHEHFNPRVIEWMSGSQRLRNVPSAAYQEHVEGLLADPRAIWSDAFNHQLSHGARSLLLALYTLGDWCELTELEPAWAALHENRARKYNFTTDPRDFMLSLKELDNAFVTYSTGHASFLNPSVQEFVGAEVSAYAAHVLDVVNAAIRFKQIARICEMGGKGRKEFVHRTLLTNEEMLIANMQRLLHTEHLSWRRENGQLRGTVVDLSLESRLTHVAKVAEMLESQRVLELCAREIEALTAKYATTIDYSYAASLVLSLDDLRWVQSNGGQKLQRDLLTATLADLSGVHSQNLGSLLDCEEKARCWTPTDSALLRSAIAEYREDGIDAEIHGCDDEDQLQGLRDDLESLAERLKVSFKTKIESIDEKLAELPEKPRPTAGSGFASRPNGVDPIEDDDDDSDDALRTLFGTLLEPE